PVAGADDELVDPVSRVDLQDVPEDRLPADLDHGLRAHSTFFADPRAEATRQDRRLHRAHSSPVAVWRGACSAPAEPADLLQRAALPLGQVKPEVDLLADAWRSWSDHPKRGMAREDLGGLIGRAGVEHRCSTRG